MKYLEPAPLPLSCRRPPARLLRRCLAASLVAHALAFAFADGPRPAARPAGGIPIKVSLRSPDTVTASARMVGVEPTSPAARRVTSAPAARANTRRPDARPFDGAARVAVESPPASPAEVAPPAAVAATAPAQAAPAPSPLVAVAATASGAPAGAADDAAMLAAYTQALSEAVAPHKQYPGIARIRGWQGTALVEVSVGAAGNVLATRISRSSGHEILDRQAVDMIHRAEPLPVLPDRSGERQMLVRLPIRFTLVD